MEQIAIKTLGELNGIKIIEYLTSLGYKNSNFLKGNADSGSYYYIEQQDRISCVSDVNFDRIRKNCKIYNSIEDHKQQIEASKQFYIFN